MATTEDERRPRSRSRIAGSRRWPVLAFWLILSGVSGCGGPPQMGPDRDAFTAIDALYTAVSLREPPRVDRCAATLAKLRDEGKLPPAAHDALAAIMSEAKGGAWESAQGRLREFMLGQRR